MVKKTCGYRMRWVNLFRTKDRGDREYNPAGQLLRSGYTSYKYDGEGNLIERTVGEAGVRRHDLGTWQYRWNGAGRLTEVLRPDGDTVSFTYDALGRRLSKSYRDKTTRWAWDGNVPLHEWLEDNRKSSEFAKTPDDCRIFGGKPSKRAGHARSGRPGGPTPPRSERGAEHLPLRAGQLHPAGQVHPHARPERGGRPPRHPRRPVRRRGPQGLGKPHGHLRPPAVDGWVGAGYVLSLPGSV